MQSKGAEAAAPTTSPVVSTSDPPSTPISAPASAPVPTAGPGPVPVPAIAPALSQVAAPTISIDALAALTGMGFPEAECKAALLAAGGQPDVAYEFLLSGIPEGAVLRSGAHVPSGTTGIQKLREHPQFNTLKQLIQSNPASIPQVLQLIGQQSPALLDAIHSNEQEFLAMMNEPINLSTPSVPPSGSDNAGSPAQMIQLLASMPPAQRAQFAQTLGLSPEQLSTFMQMMSSMPPEQLQQLMSSAAIGAPAGGAPPPGTIALTRAEVEAVERLQGLGFSQQQALQAYIACDKNEELAANFLFENGWGDDDGAGDFGAADDGHDDDMYG